MTSLWCSEGMGYFQFVCEEFEAEISRPFLKVRCRGLPRWSSGQAPPSGVVEYRFDSVGSKIQKDFQKNDPKEKKSQKVRWR